MKPKRYTIPAALAFTVLCLGAALAQDTSMPAAMKARGADYCVECHKTQTGTVGNAVTEWKRGVHSKNENGCNICHGGNPDLNDKKESKAARYNFIGKPAKRTAADFCGRSGCHQSTVETFKKGPHYNSMLSGGNPSCVSCHGAHDIRSPRVAMIQPASCTACHSAGDVEKVLDLLAGIESLMDSIRNDISHLARKNAESRDLAEKLMDAKLLYHGLVHTMSAGEFKYSKKELDFILGDLDRQSRTRVLIAKRLDLIYFITLGLSTIIVLVFAVFTIRVFSGKKQ